MIPICGYCHSSRVKVIRNGSQILLICSECGKITDLSDDGGTSPLVIG